MSLMSEKSEVFRRPERKNTKEMEEKKKEDKI